MSMWLHEFASITVHSIDTELLVLYGGFDRSLVAELYHQRRKVPFIHSL